MRDVNISFPIGRLRELIEQRQLGGFAPRCVSRPWRSAGVRSRVKGYPRLPWPRSDVGQGTDATPNRRARGRSVLRQRARGGVAALRAGAISGASSRRTYRAVPLSVPLFNMATEMAQLKRLRPGRRSRTSVAWEWRRSRSFLFSG
jgi:hypothetical protein